MPDSVPQEAHRRGGQSLWGRRALPGKFANFRSCTTFTSTCLSAELSHPFAAVAGTLNSTQALNSTQEEDLDLHFLTASSQSGVPAPVPSGCLGKMSCPLGWAHSCDGSLRTLCP